MRQEASRLAIAGGRARHDTSELAYKRAEFAAIRDAALSGLPGISVERSFRNIPQVLVRVDSEEVLQALGARPGVKALHDNAPIKLKLTQTLPFIAQTAVESAGVGGQGTTIGVLDTGVDYLDGAFGCTAPGAPAACRVAAATEVAGAADGSLDDVGHGSNVSGIAVGVAGEARVAVADVFYYDPFDDDWYTNSSLVGLGIDWLIDNRDTYNIAVVNLSLGDDSIYTVHCTTSAFVPSMQMAIDAGIQPVVSSGNTAIYLGSFYDGVANPACVAGVVSVGAVYDQNYGSRTHPPSGLGIYACTDSTTVADQVACFSQTSPFLSLLAPGVDVTAGGEVDYTGTSMAAPHVAGAWAVMRAAMPNASNAAILSALQTGGATVTDTRPEPDRVTRRLRLFDALDSDSDTVLFPLDNCSALANTNQVNADGDACGNRCDGDFDDSSWTSIGDFTTFKACYTRQEPVGAPGGPANDPNCLESDMDGTGAMSIGDFVDFKIEYTSGGGFPGPSGLPSAAPGTACAP